VLFDSDVLIWVLRDHVAAEQFVADGDTRSLSIITYMELVQGARDRQDLHRVKSMLHDFGFEMIPLSEAIGHRASIYLEEHTLSSGLEMADALVAATAVERNLRLGTANLKHYRPIKDLEIRPFRP